MQFLGCSRYMNVNCSTASADAAFRVVVPRNVETGSSFLIVFLMTDLRVNCVFVPKV